MRIETHFSVRNHLDMPSIRHSNQVDIIVIVHPSNVFGESDVIKVSKSLDAAMKAFTDTWEGK
jgi:hypothetical protein